MTLFASLLLALFLALTFLVYRPPLNRSMIAPLVLRVLAVAVLVLIATGVRIQGTTRRLPRPDLVVLVDSSRSMRAPDKARALVDLGRRGPVPGNARAPLVIGFADSVRRRWPDAGTTRDRTDLAVALAWARTREPGALLLVSDGMVNAGDDPVAAARAVGVPILTVGIGRPLPADLAVSAVSAPPRAWVGDTVRITARCAAHGFAPGTAAVRLEQGTRVLARTEIGVGSAFAEHEAELVFVPSRPGTVHLRVRVEPPAGDANPADDEAWCELEVDDHRLRVCYVTNHPTPTGQFLDLWFAGHDEVELTRRVAFRTGELRAVAADRVSPGSLRLDRTDVIVLDNFDGSSEPGLDAALATWVRAGGGLFVLDGRESRLGPELAGLVPLVHRAGGAGGEFAVRLTEAGLAEPCLLDQGENLLAELPRFTADAGAATARSGAVVWAEDSARTPRVAFGRAGAGRIVEVNIGALWRAWFVAAGLGEPRPAFARLWYQLVRFLGLGSDDLLLVRPAQPVFRSGDEVVVDAWVREADGTPRRGAELELGLAPGRRTVVFTDQGDGRYQARLGFLPAGRYDAEVRVAGTNLARRRAIDVATTSREDFDAGRNDRLLAELAASTGGRYIPVESLPARLPITVAPRVRSWSLRPQSSPWWYLLFVALFGAELALRTRAGKP